MPATFRSFGLIGLILAITSAPGFTDPGEERPGLSQYLGTRVFLHRPAPRYANHAFRDYQLPETAYYAQRQYYDQLGNSLIRGYDVYEWVQQRSTNWSLGTDRTAIPDRVFPYQVMVASESHKDWATSLIVGSESRRGTRFTPLTVSNWRSAGVQLDVETRHAATSLLVGPSHQWEQESRAGWWALGGHTEVRLGALRLGATLFDFQLYDVRQPDFSFTGDLSPSQPLPSYVVVKFLDDSPDDQVAGAYVQDVILHVNGQARPDLQPDLVRVNARNPTALGRRNRITGQFNRTLYDDEGTKYADYFSLLRHLDGESVRNVNLDELVRWMELLPPGVPARADGDDVVLAYFDLRREPYVRQVEVEALVGNDYRVEVVSLYERDPRQLTDLGRWAVGGVEAERRSRGNVQDLSNLRRLRLTTGAETATVVMGLDGAWEAYGGRLRWEVVRQLHSRQYPDGQPGYRPESDMLAPRPWRGARHFDVGEARYLHFEWDRGRAWRYGFELFHMGPRFVNRFIWGYEPWFQPGRDRDGDGFPDDNRNWNGAPDYDEPFLQFHSEPLDYLYGRDWDHNGMADDVEDRPWDYWETLGALYDADQRGAHGFLLCRLGRGWEATVGRLAAQGLAQGGRNDNTYAQIALRWETRAGDRLWTEHRVERVHDDIADPYGLRQQQPDTTLTREPIYDLVNVLDPREWRNSVGHEHYAEVEWHPAAGARLDGNLRYAVNHQRGGALVEGRDLGKDRLARTSWVVRGEWGCDLIPRLKATAQGKLMALRLTRRKGARSLRNEWRAVPILRADYELAPHTALSLGVQGLPLLPARIRDRAEPRHSLRERVWVLQLKNTSNYLGYDVAMLLGVRSSRRDYDDPARELDDRDVLSIFLRTVVGWEAWTTLGGGERALP